MTQSILLTVKKMLGIAEEYHAFDLDIIIHINSVFLTLNQLGVGPDKPFQIVDESEIWSDFVDVKEVPGVQTYVYLKTRLLFDPPTNSFLVDAIQKQIAELEWRMNVQVDPKQKVEETPQEPTEPETPEEPKPVEPLPPPVIEIPDVPEAEPEVASESQTAFSMKSERAIDRLLKKRKEVAK